MKRAFEFIDEKSHKFWWIESFQEKFVVNYGKIDSVGKYEIKEWDSIEAVSYTHLTLPTT